MSCDLICDISVTLRSTSLIFFNECLRTIKFYSICENWSSSFGDGEGVSKYTLVKNVPVSYGLRRYFSNQEQKLAHVIKKASRAWNRLPKVTYQQDPRTEVLTPANCWPLTSHQGKSAAVFFKVSCKTQTFPITELRSAPYVWPWVEHLMNTYRYF